MVQARGEHIITALDIGSSKISAMIAERDADGELRVLGTGQRESKGVQRGYISDMHAAEMAIREAVEQAERISGEHVQDVWVGFSAGGLVSDILPVEVELAGHRIEQEDIDELLFTGGQNLDVAGRIVLHAQPTLYTLDGLQGVKKPIGLHADRLGVDVHVVSAESSPVRNIDQCVRNAMLGVKSIIASPVATGYACLSEEERELGVALIEMGAGVTNISLFAGGMLAGLTSLPMGAADITDDIASHFGMRREVAERLKCFHGSATTSPRDNHDMLDIAPLGGSDDGSDAQRITKAQMIAVIRERLRMMTDEIEAALKRLGFAGPVGRQVVLTGGGAELKGVADYLQGTLGRVVRVGRPRGLIGLPEAHGGPAFSALAGLVHHAASNPADLRQFGMSSDELPGSGRGETWLERLVRLLKTAF
ncbi:cell division protein FtsA [Aquisediminimonas sediminicola]|uniref:cell division protein FtsA n=1 Tax=Alteraquisediminimonas sediminicola TaxID=2676787 RepID=UPI001C8DFC1F|nr:cell division protein FtsA [Aquisediminimonas sediminicola]